MIDVRRFLPQYFAEAAEYLDELEQCLALLFDSGWNASVLERAARAAHCIKGNSGAFGFDEIVCLAGALEQALRRADVSGHAAHPDFRRDCEQARALLASLVEARQAARSVDAGAQQELVLRLSAWQAQRAEFL